MNTGTWIALYAAIVGSAGFAWQAVTYVAARRPKIRVQLDLLHYVGMNQNVYNKAGVTDHDWELQITILNLGRSLVRVKGLSIETNRDESGVDLWISEDWATPWALEPGDEKVAFLTDNDAGPLRRGQELRAAVRTTTGPEFFSEVLRIPDKASKREMVFLAPEYYEEAIKRFPDLLPKFMNRVIISGGAPADTGVRPKPDDEHGMAE